MTKILPVRLSAEEHARLAERARQAGVPTSVYARACLLFGRPTPAQTARAVRAAGRKPARKA